MWQRKKSKNAKKPAMRELVHAFCLEELPESLSSNPDVVNSMVAILHSHRHKKGESFAHDIDFSVVRAVLYSYSTEARERFTSNHIYAALFNHFTERGVREFIESKVHNNPLYACELETEFQKLQVEVITSLGSQN